MKQNKTKWKINEQMNSFGKFFFDMSKNKNTEIKTGCGRFIKQRQMNASCSEDKHLNTPEHTCTHSGSSRAGSGEEEDIWDVQLSSPCRSRRGRGSSRDVQAIYLVTSIRFLTFIRSTSTRGKYCGCKHCFNLPSPRGASEQTPF